MDFPISVPSIGLVGGKFVDEDPLTGTPGSLIPSQWGNAVTEEVLNAIVAAGLTPDEENNAQLVAAIRLLQKQPVLVNDIGAVNAYAAVNAPALTALPAKGYVQRIVIANSNTGPATYAPDGLAAKPIYGLGLQPLQGGELPVGIAVLMYLVQAGVNGGNGAWIIIESLGGASQVAPATQSAHAMQLGQATGRLIAVRKFDVPGTSVYTPTPGTRSIIVEVCGGGGGGGSNSHTPSAGFASVGSGGSAGATAKGEFNGSFAGLLITVGAGGAGGVVSGSGSNGSNGGSSSLGALISAGGGVGGLAGIVVSVFPTSSPEQSSIAAGVGGTIFNGAGAAGDKGILYAANNVSSGKGASTAYGAGGYSKSLAAGTGQQAGAHATGYGAGGGGAASVTGGSNTTGGNGSPGFVIIWERS